jgi:hypothetical protein
VAEGRKFGLDRVAEGFGRGREGDLLRRRTSFDRRVAGRTRGELEVALGSSVVAVLDVGKINVARRLEENVRIDGKGGNLARAERAFGRVLGDREVEFVAELPPVWNGRSGVAAERLRRADASESSTASILLVTRVRVVALAELLFLDLLVPV